MSLVDDLMAAVPMKAMGEATAAGGWRRRDRRMKVSKVTGTWRVKDMPQAFSPPVSSPSLFIQTGWTILPVRAVTAELKSGHIIVQLLEFDTLNGSSTAHPNVPL